MLRERRAAGHADGKLEAEAVVEPAATAHGGDSCQGDEERELYTVKQGTHLLPLETKVLERLGGPPVETCGLLVKATSGGEVALSDPCRGPMAGRGKL